MSEPQSAAVRPAGRSTPPELLRAASGPGEQAAADGTTRPPAAAGPARIEAARIEAAQTDPAGDHPAGPDSGGPEPTASAAGTPALGDGDEPTDVVAPRWSGSAPVPPAPPRKRRWLETLVDVAAEPPPRDPALPLPAEDRAVLESRTPVDPWAGADLWGPHAVPYAPVEPYPPTRPYPVAQPHSPPPGPAVPPGQSALRPPPAPPQPARKPVKPDKRGRRGRGGPAPYGPPPPGWRPPPGYVAVAVRRRRRWPWIMLLLTVACCCGIPAYLGGPMWRQYPATAALPAQVADLRLREDPASERTAQRLEREMLASYWAKDTFAGVYLTGNGKRVTIFGATGFRLSPDKDVDAEIARLTPDYDITGVRRIKTGTRGEYRSCGTGRANGTDIVVCTWADHGSIATGLFTLLSVEDSAELLSELRTSIVTRG